MTATKTTCLFDQAEFKKALRAIKANPKAGMGDRVSAFGGEWIVKKIDKGAIYGVVYTMTNIGPRGDVFAIEGPHKCEIEVIESRRPMLTGELSELAKIRNHEVAMFIEDRKRANA